MCVCSPRVAEVLVHACANGLLAPAHMRKWAIGAHTHPQTGHWPPCDAGGTASAPTHAQMGLVAPTRQRYHK